MAHRLLIIGVVVATQTFVAGQRLRTDVDQRPSRRPATERATRQPTVRTDRMYTGTFFDAHAHVVQPSPAGANVSTEELVTRLAKLGVTGLYLFGQEQKTLPLEQGNPGVVYAFAQVPVRAQKIQLTSATAAFVDGQLEKRMHGVAEMALRHQTTFTADYRGFAADHPDALAIYEVAARRGVPVAIHFEHEYSDELDRALAKSPRTILIWCHAGDGPASLVRSLMRKHGNLYADISTRNPYMKLKKPRDLIDLTNADGTIQSEWKATFEEFPTRFLFGLDTGTVDRIEILDSLLTYYRSVLGQLSAPTAEAIAYKNAVALLKAAPNRRF